MNCLWISFVVLGGMVSPVDELCCVGRDSGACRCW